MALKLPHATPKGLLPLSWVILAAQTEGSHPGVSVVGKDTKLVIATDGWRLHRAGVPKLAVGAGSYAPPGWMGPDWAELDPWPSTGANIEEDAGPIVASGHVGRVDALYGYCRAAIAYAQSTGMTTGLVLLRGLMFDARYLADAISGGLNDLMGAELELHGPTGSHTIRVSHRCGVAWVAGAMLREAYDGSGDPEFVCDQFVKWEE